MPKGKGYKNPGEKMAMKLEGRALRMSKLSESPTVRHEMQRVTREVKKGKKFGKALFSAGVRIRKSR